MRRDVQTLRPDDVEMTPVWQFTLAEQSVGPNGGSVRPVATSKARDGLGLYLVRSAFTFADGTTAVGYCKPRSEPPPHPENPELNIGYLAPAVLTDTGPVTFWSVDEEKPDIDRLAEQYDRLGRRPDEVFPLSFATEVEIRDDAVAAGVLPAFYSLVYKRRAERFDLYAVIDGHRVTEIPLIYP